MLLRKGALEFFYTWSTDQMTRPEDTEHSLLIVSLQNHLGERDALALPSRTRPIVLALSTPHAAQFRRLLLGSRHDLPARACPAMVAARVAYNQLVRKHRGGDHRSCADHAVFADLYPAHDRCVGTYRCPSPDHRGVHLPVCIQCTWAQIVREHGGRADEHLIGKLDATVHRHIVLDLHTVADMNAFVHKDVLAQRAVRANHRPTAYVAVMPDFRAFPYHRVGFDYGTRMHERCGSLNGRHTNDPTSKSWPSCVVVSIDLEFCMLPLQ